MSRKGKSVTTDDIRELLIKSVVQRSRRVLVEGLEQHLASLGIFKNGTRLDVSSLPDQWEAQRERLAIDAALARWESQGFDQAAAVDRFTRESSYTWLNRLAPSARWKYAASFARSQVSKRRVRGRRSWPIWPRSHLYWLNRAKWPSRCCGTRDARTVIPLIQPLRLTLHDAMKDGCDSIPLDATLTALRITSFGNDRGEDGKPLA